MQRQILLLAAIFILFFNTYSQDFWQQTNGPCGGSIRSLAINQSGYIFAGTSNGGIFRSINNGENWVETGLSAGYIRSLAVNSSGHIFAGVFWGGVYRSTDYGDSWTLLNNFYNS